MNQEQVPLSAEEKARLVDEISADVIGYGPITPFLEDPDVTEIMCNATDGVWVERRGLLEEHRDRLRLRRVAAPGHRPHRRPPSAAASTSRRPWSTPACPTAPASTPSSRRWPSTVPSLTIRKFSKMVLKAEDYIRTGSATGAADGVPRDLRRGQAQRPGQRRYRHRQDDAAQRAVQLHPASERIVTIEDAVELQLQPAPRRPPRVPPAQHRGPRRGHHPRPGPQRAAHAPRPHHRRRVPRRRGARHAPGHEHRPRGLAGHAARQHAPRRACPAWRPWC